MGAQSRLRALVGSAIAARRLGRSTNFYTRCAPVRPTPRRTARRRRLDGWLAPPRREPRRQLMARASRGESIRVGVLGVGRFGTMYVTRRGVRPGSMPPRRRQDCAPSATPWRPRRACVRAGFEVGELAAGGLACPGGRGAGSRHTVGRWLGQASQWRPGRLKEPRTAGVITNRLTAPGPDGPGHRHARSPPPGASMPTNLPFLVWP